MEFFVLCFVVGCCIGVPLGILGGCIKFAEQEFGDQGKMIVMFCFVVLFLLLLFLTTC